ncbi:MAG: CvpA family protein [Chitinophagales bacterium]
MVVDIVYLAFLAFGFFLGFRRGLVHSIFSILALFLGLAAALKYSGQLIVLIQDTFNLESVYISIGVFLLLFIVVILLVRTVAWAVESVLKTLYLNFINQLLGALLWCLVLTLVFSTFLWFADQMALISEAQKTESNTFNFIMPIAPITYSFLSEILPWFNGLFEQLSEYLKK